MDLEQKLALVEADTVEVILREELVSLLSSKKKPVVYCGYEPSGAVHLGHFVTINKLLAMQKAGFKVKILLADWHAFLNKKGDWDFIKKMSTTWKGVLKKLGLKDAEFVLGSSFQMKSQYFEDVLRLSSHTTVNRGTRSMQEVARNLDNAYVSQIIYPLMQIADVKRLKVDACQAGIEQRKIYMLARETIETIGYKKPVLVHTPLVGSLTGTGKMSSSDPNSFISVVDSADEIKKKMTDAFCTMGVIEANPVLEIAKLIIFPRFKSIELKRDKKFGGNMEFSSFAELEKEFAGRSVHPMDLKATISDYLAEMFSAAKKALEKSGIGLEEV